MTRTLAGLTLFIATFVLSVVLINHGHTSYIVAVPQLAGAVCASYAIREWWLLPITLAGLLLLADGLGIGQDAQGESAPLIIHELPIIPFILFAFFLGRSADERIRQDN